jgi:peptidyl-prolyl cis-trans isomerase-like 2
MNSYQDPFEEYKARQARKLARQEEAKNNPDGGNKREHGTADEMTWFGPKLGASENGANGATRSANGGVGKYLNLKRPAQVLDRGGVTPPEEKKRRKIGFSADFAGF